MQIAYDEPRANDIVFIFNNVKDVEQLAAAVRPGVEVHVLDSSKDGLAQMAAVVDGRSDIGSMHVISHGGAGELSLGTLTLSSANLGDYANLLGKIGSALAAGGDILLYGCDVAAGATGASFVDQLATVTGADIAASTNATGASILGGDWVLEYSHGEVAGTSALDVRAVQGLDTLLALPSNGMVDIHDSDTAAANATIKVGSGWFDMTPTLQLKTDTGSADGVFMSGSNVSTSSITIAAFGFDTFDLTGMNWVKYYDTNVPGYVGNFTFTITGYKFDHSANVTTSFSTVDLDQNYTTGDYSQFKNLSGFKIQIQTGGGTTNPSSNTFDYFSIANVDNVPTVLSSSTNIGVVQGASISLNSQLVASDSDSGQTLTWSQATGPAHGYLSFSGATASAGTGVTPGGTATYTPNSGYAGTDSFVVQVSDGINTATQTFTVSVTPSAPSAPDLATGSDTGSSSTDNITKAGSLSFTGSGTAGDSTSTVRVFIDKNGNGVYDAGSEPTGTATMSSGSWTVSNIDASGLVDGNYKVYAWSTSGSGGLTSALSSPLTITVDRTLPGTPSVPALSSASDSGTSSSDRITKTTTPTFTGTAEANSTVILYDSATQIGTATADGSGNWSITSSALSSGSHSIGATATDAAGNTSSQSSQQSITIDTTAPTLNITSSKSTLKAGDTATITFSFSEDPGTTFTWDGASGDLVVSGGTLGAISGTGGTRTATFTPTANTDGGTASITVASGSYTDPAGNNGGAGTSPSVTFDTKAPTVSVATSKTAMAPGDTATITFTFSEDPGSSFVWNGTTGDVTVTGGSLSAIAGSGTTRTATFTAGAGATASVAVTAGSYTDAAGNTGAAGTSPTISLDTTPPNAPGTPALTSADTGVSSSDYIIKSATPAFGGTAEAGSTVKLYDAATLVGTGTADGSGNWSITASALADGSHHITATATDAAGNVSPASSALDLTTDTAAPTLAITSDKASLKAGETATITFTFSEDPDSTFTWDGSVGDVSVTGGTLSAMSGTGTVRTAVFTPGANTNGGNATISVASAAYTDIAGNNGGAGSTSLSFDTLAPSAPSTPALDSGSDSGTATDNLTKVQTPQLDGTAEAGATVKLYDGATLVGSGTANGSGNWTITTSTLLEGSHTLTATATDAAGNTGPASGALTLDIDTTAPALVITSDKPALKAGETATITFSFSEDPGASFSWNGATGDVSVSGGTLSAISGSGSTRTATFTPAADTNAGTASITVAAAAYTDAAGNNGGAGTTPGVHFDTLVPAVTITSDKAVLKVGETATITFTFSEDPGTSFAWDGSSGDITVSGGTLSAISGTGTTRTAVFTPTASTNGGNASIGIAAGAYADAAGNDGTSGATSLTFDTLAPAAPSVPVLDSGSDSGTTHDNRTSDTTPQLNGTAEAGATVKLYDGATQVGSTTADGSGNWSITASTLAEGSHSLTATATDAAGNIGTASVALTLNIDTTAPTLAITSDKGALKVGETATITFTFSEDPGASFSWDGASGDVVVSGGTLSAISGSGNIRTATFTPSASVNSGTPSIAVAAGTYTDAAGNSGGAGATPSIHYDTLAPTVAITSSASALKIGETATITFTFSEDPGTSFAWDGTTGDLTVSGGTLSAISGTGAVRTAVFTPAAGTAGGTATIAIAAGAYTDAAGNDGAAGTTPSLHFDTLAPSAPSAPALDSGSDSGIANDNATRITTPQLNGTAEAGATVKLYDGATQVGSTMADGSGNWSIATSTLAEGNHTITATATDAAGNTGAASGALTLSIDTTAPTLAITSDKAALKSGETATITFTFSEDPGTTFNWDGSSGDVSVSGGTLSAISGSGTVRTATFTPTADSNAGTASITVAGGAYADAAGNIGGAGITPSVHFDTLAPTVAITSDKAALKIGETASITFTFSEDPGTSFSWDGTSGDVAVSGGTLSAISGSGTVRTAVFTPTASTNGGVASITVADASYADAAGNAGHARTAPGLAFDTLTPPAPSAPALAAASDSGASHTDALTNASSLTFTGTAEAGATVSVIDDTTKAVLGTGVATGGNWSIAVSSAAQPDGAFHVAAIATDAAGNVGVQSAATHVMLDRVAPSAPTVSLDVDSGVVGDNVTNVGRVKVLGFETNATWEYSLDSGAHWQPGSGAFFLVPSPGVWTVTARQSDAAGNASASASPLTFTLTANEPRPAATISLSDTSLTNGETALVTIVFNTRVTGFTLDDISAPNGTLSGLSSNDGGRTWTVTLTPQPGVTADTNNISINNAGVADTDGNAGSGTSTSPTYSVFTAGVSAAITMSDTSLLAGETSVVTIVFSEAVNGFALSRLDAPNGKLSGLQSSDGRTFTALFTPSVNISDTTNAITLDNSSVVGAHGAQGSGISRSSNYVVETVRPTATVSVADHLIAQGGKTTLTVKFSQPVAGFDSADLDVSHATLANLTSADGGLTWTATLTADSGGKAATPGRVALHLDGVHNAVGNAGSGLADAQFVITSANAKSASVDGVQVVTDSFTNTSGHQEQITAVPLVPAGRVDDAATPHGTLADIPLVPATTPGNAPVLSASLPTGAGLLVQGPAAPLPPADALTDLIARITDKTGANSSTQSDMIGSGQSFVAALGAGATIVSSTVVPTVAPGSTLGQPIVISGASPVPGTPPSTVVGLVIDATGLPSGSTLQLDNVNFAAVTGNVRLFGGLGQNYVVGDAGSQTIYLGPDDDILAGGGGNDFIGSAGGNDTLDGGDGDDLVAGGIGNDRVSGGSGDDMVNGGRSTVGSWNFFVSATGAVTARHDGAVFTISGSETVQGAELNASVPELGFLKADPQKVAGIALLYAGLDRAPDLAGLSFWATSGASLGDVAAGVLASSEFGGGPLGQIDNASFVRGMYQHVLGRAAEEAAVGYWTARLSGSDGKAAASRADVLVAVALSDEHKAAALGASGYTVAQASVKQETGWFAGSGDDRLSGGPGNDLLVGGDGIDTAVYDGKASQYRITLGSDNAIHVVDTANGDVDTLSGIEKAEFKDGTLDLAFTAANPAQLARIGMLYQTVLDRPVDAAGLNWWVATGMDAAQLAQAITGTAEFQSHYGGMGNAAFVQALYANSGLSAAAAGGEQSWEAYLGSHTRAQLIANWITQDDVVHAQFGAAGLWLV